MRGFKRGWLTAGLLVGALSFASQAEATVYNGVTKAQVEAVLTSAGKTFKEVKDNLLELEQGRLLLLSSCPADGNGTCYEIYVVDLVSEVKPTLQGVNQWNNQMRAPEASVDSDGMLQLTMFVTTVGITEQLLLDTLSWLDTTEHAEAFGTFWRPYLASPSS